MRSLATFKKAPAQPAVVDADAVAAAIGGEVGELVRRYGSQGDNWLGRPTISFEDAQAAVAAARQKQNEDDLLPVRYDIYREDRRRRLQELLDAATAEARATFVGPHRGGQETQRYMEVQWAAGRKVRAEFEAREPEMTVSQFREWEKHQ